MSYWVSDLLNELTGLLLLACVWVMLSLPVFMCPRLPPLPLPPLSPIELDSQQTELSQGRARSFVIYLFGSI